MMCYSIVIGTVVGNDSGWNDKLEVWLDQFKLYCTIFSLSSFQESTIDYTATVCWFDAKTVVVMWVVIEELLNLNDSGQTVFELSHLEVLDISSLIMMIRYSNPASTMEN